ncbi:MAG: zinc ribbon domain-containing protein [Candidatus Rokuibacteriota bacterium]
MEDSSLQRLSELQGLDTRIAGLERKLEAIPGRRQAIVQARRQAQAAEDAQSAMLENVRREIRSRQKDLEYNASQKAKGDAKLYEVKTNKEYSAVLAEIETSKAEQARIEEDILGLMESEERLVREMGEGKKRRARQDEEFKTQEAAALEEERALEGDLAGVRGERASVARDVPRDLLAQYSRLLKGRGGLAVAVVGASAICSGCRMSITPQRLQEIRNSSQILTCESCGRILSYQP